MIEALVHLRSRPMHARMPRSSIRFYAKEAGNRRRRVKTKRKSLEKEEVKNVVSSVSTQEAEANEFFTSEAVPAWLRARVAVGSSEGIRARSQLTRSVHIGSLIPPPLVRSPLSQSLMSTISRSRDHQINDVHTLHEESQEMLSYPRLSEDQKATLKQHIRTLAVEGDLLEAWMFRERSGATDEIEILETRGIPVDLNEHSDLDVLAFDINRRCKEPDCGLARSVLNAVHDFRALYLNPAAITLSAFTGDASFLLQYVDGKNLQGKEEKDMPPEQQAPEQEGPMWNFPKGAGVISHEDHMKIMAFGKLVRFGHIDEAWKVLSSFNEHLADGLRLPLARMMLDRGLEEAIDSKRFGALVHIAEIGLEKQWLRPSSFGAVVGVLYGLDRGQGVQLAHRLLGHAERRKLLTESEWARAVWNGLLSCKCLDHARRWWPRILLTHRDLGAERLSDIWKLFLYRTLAAHSVETATDPLILLPQALRNDPFNALVMGTMSDEQLANEYAREMLAVEWASSETISFETMRKMESLILLSEKTRNVEFLNVVRGQLDQSWAKTKSFVNLHPQMQLDLTRLYQALFRSFSRLSQTVEDYENLFQALQVMQKHDFPLDTTRWEPLLAELVDAGLRHGNRLAPLSTLVDRTVTETYEKRHLITAIDMLSELKENHLHEVIEQVNKVFALEQTPTSHMRRYDLGSLFGTLSLAMIVHGERVMALSIVKEAKEAHHPVPPFMLDAAVSTLARRDGPVEAFKFWLQCFLLYEGLLRAPVTLRGALTNESVTEQLDNVGGLLAQDHLRESLWMVCEELNTQTHMLRPSFEDLDVPDKLVASVTLPSPEPVNGTREVKIATDRVEKNPERAGSSEESIAQKAVESLRLTKIDRPKSIVDLIRWGLADVEAGGAFESIVVYSLSGIEGRPILMHPDGLSLVLDNVRGTRTFINTLCSSDVELGSRDLAKIFTAIIRVRAKSSPVKTSAPELVTVLRQSRQSFDGMLRALRLVTEEITETSEVAVLANTIGKASVKMDLSSLVAIGQKLLLGNSGQAVGSARAGEAEALNQILRLINAESALAVPLLLLNHVQILERADRAVAGKERTAVIALLRFLATGDALPTGIQLRSADGLSEAWSYALYRLLRMKAKWPEDPELTQVTARLRRRIPNSLTNSVPMKLMDLELQLVHKPADNAHALSTILRGSDSLRTDRLLVEDLQRVFRPLVQMAANWSVKNARTLLDCFEIRSDCLDLITLKDMAALSFDTRDRARLISIVCDQCRIDAGTFTSAMKAVVQEQRKNADTLRLVVDGTEKFLHLPPELDDVLVATDAQSDPTSYRSCPSILTSLLLDYATSEAIGNDVSLLRRVWRVLSLRSYADSYPTEQLWKWIEALCNGSHPDIATRMAVLLIDTPKIDMSEVCKALPFVEKELSSSPGFHVAYDET
eukprot:Clim_evm96s243 gene=Clim_evmTU96s243